MSDPYLPEIVPATPRDAEFVRRLSGEVFARFGRYDRLLPQLMRLPAMRTAIARSGDTRIGFAMYAPESGEIELVAIAVERHWQSRGVGRALLGFVESEALALCAGGPARVRLTVAEDNTVARGLFESSGYVRVPGTEGLYDGGQRSFGLAKRVR